MAAHSAPLRATQGFVGHMGFCRRNPSLTAIEIGWRWLFAAPILFVAWQQAQRILEQIPTASAGLDRLRLQDPWLSSQLLAGAGDTYHAPVVAVLRWLAPAGLVAWGIISGLGRTLVLSRMAKLSGDSGSAAYLRHAPAVMVLQCAWATALVGILWLWYRGNEWNAEVHISGLPTGAQPQLEGYLIWLILITLGLYVVWAAVSWVLTIAPIVAVHEDRSLLSAVGRSFTLGVTLSGKLVEINLVMSSVKIALMVLALVFSAAPLPFSDQIDPGSLGYLYLVIAVAGVIASDYFHVVRLKSFTELWRFYCVKKLSATSH